MSKRSNSSASSAGPLEKKAKITELGLKLEEKLEEVFKTNKILTMQLHGTGSGEVGKCYDLAVSKFAAILIQSCFRGFLQRHKNAPELPKVGQVWKRKDGTGVNRYIRQIMTAPADNCDPNRFPLVCLGGDNWNMKKFCLAFERVPLGPLDTNAFEDQLRATFAKYRDAIFSRRDEQKPEENRFAAVLQRRRNIILLIWIETMTDDQWEKHFDTYEEKFIGEAGRLIEMDSRVHWEKLGPCAIVVSHADPPTPPAGPVAPKAGAARGIGHG